MDKQIEKFIIHNRSSFDELDPDPQILDRIKYQLSKRQTGGRVIVFRMVRWTAAAVFISLAGFGLFHLFQLKSDKRQLDIAAQGNELMYGIKPLKNQLDNDKNLMDNVINGTPLISSNNLVPQISAQKFYVGLANPESAGKRISAVSYISRISKIDHAILSALVKTINNDPNSNVRLAALEALGRFSNETFVKDQLIKSLSIQKDPIIQIALIELLTNMRERKIIDELERIANDESEIPPVKEQAYKSLINLNS